MFAACQFTASFYILDSCRQGEAALSIRSVIRALNVLDCFEPDKQRLTLHEISETLQLAKSTTFRLLQTLVDAGYLIQIDSMHYGLSLKVLRLGNCILPNVGAREIARPEMERINVATQETVALSEFLGDERIIIDVVESTLPLKLVLRAGELVGHDRGATGQVFLAHHPERLQQFLKNHKKDKRKIEEDIEHVLESGYAFTTGSRMPGSAGLAVPIFDMNNECRYSIGIYGPDTRLTDKLEPFIKILKESANKISSRLGSSITLP